MKTIKVLLGDLRHHTIGVHSVYVPVGVGYIATYLQKVIPSINFDIKITVHPDEALELVDDWKPDVIGLSNYIWNSNLSYRICEYSKEKNRNTLCILGGPEFPAGTGASFFTKIIKKECFDYLKEKEYIDFYCYSDGETSFASVVKEYVDLNFNTILLKERHIAPKGAMCLSNNKKELLIGPPILRLGLNNKVDGRDCIPSPYLTGLLDKYLNGKFIPSFETARGCPFFCTFCDQGLDMTKIVSFSTKRMCDELDYVCEKVTKFDGIKSIAFHDSNWGMYQKDVILSDHILKLINKHDWPLYMEVATPKNKREQFLDIDKKLKNRVGFGMAQQSMNEETLKEIKRDNLTNEEYIRLVKRLEQDGKNTSCELIIPLPGETKHTYFNSTKILLDCGVRVGTYTLMMLYGAELGREEAIQKYGMKSKWRIVPRDFGIYRGKKVFDVERVCVGTNTMPYDDYLECRRFSFIVIFFSNFIFAPIRRLLEKDLDIKYYDFIKLIFDYVENNKKNNLKLKKFSKIYLEYSNETEDELFNSREEIYEFYSKEENYKKLLNSEMGDNLLRKYEAKAIANSLNEIIDFSLKTILKMVYEKPGHDPESENMINAVGQWLKNLYILDSIFDWENQKTKEPILRLNYDVPKWFFNNSSSLKEFKTQTDYHMKYNKKNEVLKNEILNLFGDKDKIFAIGKYLHQMSPGPDDIMKSSIKVTN
jgi:radical SAM superfamily enzyme YgiQ (UPF0313 family)